MSTGSVPPPPSQDARNRDFLNQHLTRGNCYGISAIAAIVIQSLFSRREGTKIQRINYPSFEAFFEAFVNDRNVTGVLRIFAEIFPEKLIPLFNIFNRQRSIASSVGAITGSEVGSGTRTVEAEVTSEVAEKMELLQTAFELSDQELEHLNAILDLHAAQQHAQAAADKIAGLNGIGMAAASFVYRELAALDATVDGAKIDLSGKLAH
jgi:hypothetical protein